MTQNGTEAKWSEHKNTLYGWDDGKVYIDLDDLGAVCVSEEPELMKELVELCQKYYYSHGNHSHNDSAPPNGDIILVEPTAKSLAGLSRFIGTGKGSFATPEDADQFIRDERD
jgi:hypothetical protein